MKFCQKVMEKYGLQSEPIILQYFIKRPTFYVFLWVECFNLITCNTLWTRAYCRHNSNRWYFSLWNPMRSMLGFSVCVDQLNLSQFNFENVIWFEYRRMKWFLWVVVVQYWTAFSPCMEVVISDRSNNHLRGFLKDLTFIIAGGIPGWKDVGHFTLRSNRLTQP